MILEQEVRRTIDHAEEKGDWIEEVKSGRRLASLRVGCVTYWVEYSAGDDEFVVHDAYSHRMEVR